MIILFKNEKVIDVVKAVETEGTGTKATRYNDSKVIYFGITSTEEIEGTPNIDFTRISDYAYANGVFTKKKKTTYTKKEFLDIFTREQVLAMWNSSDANVKYFVASMSMLDEIRLDNTETTNALAYLSQEGLITQEQYNEII